jgi:hypothetical protein
VAAHRALKAGARERAWTRLTFSRRIRSISRAALPSMISGFFDWAGICARRPPSASSLRGHASALGRHQGLAAGATTARGDIDRRLLGAAGFKLRALPAKG